jgi:KUP system potassium uptake protein
VVLVTFITTCMVSIAAIIVWRLHLLLVLAGFLFFACLDGLYLSSALTKVPNGAWFTLMLAFVLASIIITWRHGKETQWTAERSDRIPVSYLLSVRDGGKVYLRDGVGKDEDLVKVKGEPPVQSCIT